MSLMVPTGVVCRVPFRGQEIEGLADEDGRVWISLRRLCDNLSVTGIRDQIQKVKEDETFEERYKVILMPSNGGEQATFCLDLEVIPFWLGSIQVNRIKNQKKRKMIVLYRRECMRVLRDHFFGSPVEPDRSDMLSDWDDIPDLLFNEGMALLDHLRDAWHTRWEIADTNREERMEEEKWARVNPSSTGQDSATEGGESTATLEAVVGPIFGAIQSLEGKIDQQQEILTGGYTLLDAQGISPARLQRLRSMVQRITSLNDGQLACLDDCISSLEKGMYLQISPPSR